MTTIKTQNFGIEIELTGITREQAAAQIADYFGTEYHFIGQGCYNIWGATDRKGRTWKCERDASICCEDRYHHAAGDTYSCEVVSPILQYDDLEDLQNIVRKLRDAGALANESCGIHVHIDGANHTADSLIRLVNLVVGRQDLFCEALQNESRCNRWCQKTSREMMVAMKKGEHTKANIERIYYSELNNGYRGGINHQHYCPARYRGLNLHALYTKGTVEFRLFNGTTHAGKIKAYIQFCLAMSAWAINSTKDPYFKSTSSYTKEQKLTIMEGFLTKRLGMSGAEFKTARTHLTAAFREAC